MYGLSSPDLLRDLYQSAMFPTDMMQKVQQNKALQNTIQKQKNNWPFNDISSTRLSLNCFKT